MILDTSALAAIFFAEPEAARFTQIIHDADPCRISAANFVELAIAIEGQIGPDAKAALPILEKINPYTPKQDDAIKRIKGQ